MKSTPQYWCLSGPLQLILTKHTKQINITAFNKSVNTNICGCWLEDASSDTAHPQNFVKNTISTYLCSTQDQRPYRYAAIAWRMTWFTIGLVQRRQSLGPCDFFVRWFLRIRHAVEAFWLMQIVLYHHINALHSVTYLYPVKEGQWYINLNPGHLLVQQPPKNGKGSRGSFKLLR